MRLMSPRAMCVLRFLSPPSARYARHRTPFIYVPEEYDRNSSESMAVVNAALCAGLYPKLLIVDSGGVQQLKTLSNNQLVSFHPSSVNFGRRPLDFGVNYLSYFTIMCVHSIR